MQVYKLRLKPSEEDLNTFLETAKMVCCIRNGLSFELKKRNVLDGFPLKTWLYDVINHHVTLSQCFHRIEEIGLSLERAVFYKLKLEHNRLLFNYYGASRSYSQRACRAIKQYLTFDHGQILNNKYLFLPDFATIEFECSRKNIGYIYRTDIRRENKQYYAYVYTFEPFMSPKPIKASRKLGEEYVS